LASDPDGGGAQIAPVTTYVYDDASQVTSITGPMSRTTGLAYDKLGRLTVTTLPDPDGGGSQVSPKPSVTIRAQLRGSRSRGSAISAHCKRKPIARWTRFAERGSKGNSSMQGSDPTGDYQAAKSAADSGDSVVPNSPSVRKSLPRGQMGFD
jgi:YD repeat-containing protein